jgi:hypothetical protein
MAHPEISPYAQLDEIEAMLVGKDPYLVFDLDSEGGRIGTAYLIAMENPGSVTLHRWSTPDEETAYLDCFWQGPYDEAKEYDPAEQRRGIARLLAILADEGGQTEEVPVSYQGALSLEDVVSGALAWLKKYGSHEKEVDYRPPGTSYATQLGIGSTGLAFLANHVNNAARRAMA